MSNSIIRRTRLIAALALSGLALPATPAAQAQAAQPAMVSTQTDPEYVLGADDKVHITVFGEEHLSGDYGVTSGGVISFPLVGNVPAAGRSLNAVQDDIRGRLARGYLKDPRVAIEVATFRSLYVLGEVNKPGEYPFRTNLTLDQAVATAGGFTYRAARRKIFIRHVGQAADVRVSSGGDDVVHLQPGDTVRIGERFF